MEAFMESVRKNPALYLTEGILFIILGTISIVTPITTTIALGFIIGWVLLIGGVYRLFRTFKLRHDQRHFWLSFVSGVVTAIVGILFISNIIKGLLFVTLALAVYFFIDGIAMILQSMTRHKGNNWGWVLFSGIVSLILGVLIMSGLPYTAAWVPGLLLGINLITSGFSLTYIAANSEIQPHRYSA